MMKVAILTMGLWLATLANAEDPGVNPNRHYCVRTHGTLMGLAFAFLFPLGAIIIRVSSVRGLVWIHAGSQVLAYTLTLTGLGLGVYIGVYPDSTIRASNGHPIIGIVVVAALLLQPITGLVHHYIYKRQGKRTSWASSHKWWGRVFVTVGIINGGLGLMLSENTVKGEIAYGVIAGAIWIVWLAVMVWSSFGSMGTTSETGQRAWGKTEHGSEDSSVKMGGMATA